MDLLLAKVTHQAMSYAIRSGIAITSTYAIKQCGRLMKAGDWQSSPSIAHSTNREQTVEGHEKQELAALQLRLDSKIKVSIINLD
jgi:hypothetical protein